MMSIKNYRRSLDFEAAIKNGSLVGGKEVDQYSVIVVGSSKRQVLKLSGRTFIYIPLNGKERDAMGIDHGLNASWRIEIPQVEVSEKK